MERTEASIKPHVLATTRTSNRYANPTVVALTGISLRAATVTAAKPAMDSRIRIGRELKVFV